MKLVYAVVTEKQVGYGNLFVNNPLRLSTIGIGRRKNSNGDKNRGSRGGNSS
jgi:hypothetical protein